MADTSPEPEHPKFAPPVPGMEPAKANGGYTPPPPGSRAALPPITDMTALTHPTLPGMPGGTPRFEDVWQPTPAPASLAGRLGARIIDGIAQGAIYTASIFVAAVIGNSVGIVFALAGMIAAAVYEPFFLATRGATPGKNVFGLRVVLTDNPSRTGIGWGPAIIRFLVFNVGILTWICILTLLFDPENRGLHDKAASTTVAGT